MVIFQKTLEVRWSDIDAYQHVTHTSYAQFATHTRVEWMRSIGFSMNHLLSLGYAGVLLKEETEYLREMFLGELVTVELIAAGQSLDYSKWKFLHNIYTSKNKLAAKNIVYGAWINTSTRKISPPPQELIDQIKNLPRCDPFEIIPV